MDRYCIKCGTKIIHGASFCEKCGEPVGGSPKQKTGKKVPAVGFFVVLFLIIVVFLVLLLVKTIIDKNSAEQKTSEITTEHKQIDTSSSSESLAQDLTDATSDAPGEAISNTTDDPTTESANESKAENVKLNNKEAMKAFSKYLAKRELEHQDGMKFALIDINQDGVDELVYSCDDGYHVDIVAYVEHKAKEVGWGFAGNQTFYPNKSIYHSETFHSCQESTYYKFTGSEMKEVAYMYDENVFQNNENEYYVEKESVTKEEYKKYVKNLIKGAKKEKLFWHKNVEKNRKQFLKYASLPKWKRVYLNQLNMSKMWYPVLKDINEDGVPEIVACSDRTGSGIDWQMYYIDKLNQVHSFSAGFQGCINYSGEMIYISGKTPSYFFDRVYSYNTTTGMYDLIFDGVYGVIDDGDEIIDRYQVDNIDVSENQYHKKVKKATLNVKNVFEPQNSSVDTKVQTLIMKYK